MLKRLPGPAVGAMVRGNRVLLAANFYGCYLDNELFDEQVVIPDAGIRQLTDAVDLKLREMQNGRHDSSSDIYVVFVVGIADLVEKRLVQDRYMLLPYKSPMSDIDTSMERACRTLSHRNAFAVWTTTYPISLVKYHGNQGWDINDMSRYGVSRNFVEEQDYLFNTTEQMMDLCHSYNLRLGVKDYFLTRKVYYSFQNQRELLVHNLREDGINPSAAVIDLWNKEMASYVAAIRRLSQRQGPLGSCPSSFPDVGGSSTLFNIGALGSRSTWYNKPTPSPFDTQVDVSQGSLSQRKRDTSDSNFFNQSKPPIKRLKKQDGGPGPDSIAPNSGEGLSNQLAMNMLKLLTSNLTNNQSGAAESKHPFPNAHMRSKHFPPVQAPATATLSSELHNQSHPKDDQPSRTINQYDYDDSAYSREVRIHSVPPHSHQDVDLSKLKGKTKCKVRKNQLYKNGIDKTQLVYADKHGAWCKVRIEDLVHLYKNASEKWILRQMQDQYFQELTSIGRQPGAPRERHLDGIDVNQLVYMNRQGIWCKHDLKSLRHLYRDKTEKFALLRMQAKHYKELTRAASSDLPKTSNLPPIDRQLRNESITIEPLKGLPEHNPVSRSLPNCKMEPNAQTKKPAIQPIPTQSQQLSRKSNPSKDKTTSGKPSSLPQLPDLLKEIHVSSHQSSMPPSMNKIKKTEDCILMAGKNKHGMYERVMGGRINSSTRTKFAVDNERRLAFFSNFPPSVNFIEVNTWKPGGEFTSFPISPLQSEIASYNVALYQLWKKRFGIIAKVTSSKDGTVRLAQTPRTYGNTEVDGDPSPGGVDDCTDQTSNLGNAAQGNDDPTLHSLEDTKTLIDSNRVHGSKSSLQRGDEDDKSSVEVDKPSHLADASQQPAVIPDSGTEAAGEDTSVAEHLCNLQDGNQVPDDGGVPVPAKAGTEDAAVAETAAKAGVSTENAVPAEIDTEDAVAPGVSEPADVVNEEADESLINLREANSLQSLSGNSDSINQHVPDGGDESQPASDDPSGEDAVATEQNGTPAQQTDNAPALPSLDSCSTVDSLRSSPSAEPATTSEDN